MVTIGNLDWKVAIEGAQEAKQQAQQVQEQVDSLRESMEQTDEQLSGATDQLEGLTEAQTAATTAFDNLTRSADEFGGIAGTLGTVTDRFTGLASSAGGLSGINDRLTKVHDSLLGVNTAAETATAGFQEQAAAQQALATEFANVSRGADRLSQTLSDLPAHEVAEAIAVLSDRTAAAQEQFGGLNEAAADSFGEISAEAETVAANIGALSETEIQQWLSEWSAQAEVGATHLTEINEAALQVAESGDALGNVSDSLVDIGTAAEATRTRLKGLMVTANNTPDLEGRVAGITDALTGLRESVTDTRDAFSSLHQSQRAVTFSPLAASASRLTRRLTGVGDAATTVNQQLAGISIDAFTGITDQAARLRSQLMTLPAPFRQIGSAATETRERVAAALATAADTPDISGAVTGITDAFSTLGATANQTRTQITNLGTDTRGVTFAPLATSASQLTRRLTGVRDTAHSVNDSLDQFDANGLSRVSEQVALVRDRFSGLRDTASEIEGIGNKVAALHPAFSKLNEQTQTVQERLGALREKQNIFDSLREKVGRLHARMQTLSESEEAVGDGFDTLNAKSSFLGTAFYFVAGIVAYLTAQFLTLAKLIGGIGLLAMLGVLAAGFTKNLGKMKDAVDIALDTIREKLKNFDVDDLQIPKQFAELGQQINKHLTELGFDKLGNIFEDGFTALGPIVESALKVIWGLLEALWAFAKPVLSEIADSFGRLADVIGEAASQFSSALSTMEDSTSTLTTIKSLMQLLGDTVADMIYWITESLLFIATAFAVGLEASGVSLKDFHTVLMAVMEGVVEGIYNAWNIIKPIFWAFVGVLGILAGVVGFVFGFIINALGWLESEFGLLSGIIELVVTVIGVFVGLWAIATVILGIVSAIGTMIAAFSALGGIILGIFVPMLGTILGGLGVAVQFFMLVASAIGTVISAVTWFVGVLGTLATIFTSTILPMISGIIAGLNPIVWVILAVIAVLVALYAAWQTNFLGIRDIVADVVAAVEGWIGGLAATGENFITTLVTGITNVAAMLPNTVMGILGDVRDLLPFSDAKKGPLSDLTASGEAFIKALVKGIKSAKSVLVNAVTNVASGAMNAAKGVLSGMGDMVKNAAGGAWDAGKSIASGIASGVQDGMDAAVNATKDMTKSINNYLPSSPAEKGPLSQLDEVGPSLVKTVGKGVRQEKQTLKDAMSGAMQAATKALPQQQMARTASTSAAHRAGQQLARTSASDVQAGARATGAATEATGMSPANLNMGRSQSGVTQSQESGTELTVNVGGVEVGDQSLDLSNLTRSEMQQLARAIADELGNEVRDKIS